MKRLFILVLLFVLGCAQGLAAISCTSLSENENSSDATSFATSSRSPTAGRLQIIFVGNTKASAPNEASTVSGDSLTFAKLTSRVSTANDERIALWYAQAASTTTGSLTVNYGAGNTQTHFLYSWFECTGTAGTNGNNGADAFNTNFVDNVGTAVTSLTMTLAAFAGSANGAVCAVALTANTAITVGSGWTAMGGGTGVGGTLPNCRLAAEYRADNDTSADMTFSSANAVGIAAELLAPSTPVPVLIYQQLLSFIGLPAWKGLLFV